MTADVLAPLVGKTKHHIQNSADFVKKIRDLGITPGRTIISYRDHLTVFKCSPEYGPLWAETSRHIVNGTHDLNKTDVN